MTIRTTFLLSLALCLACLLAEAHALPPLGLTQITPATNVGADLEVIDGTAFLNTASGIWTLDSSGSTAFLPSVNPTPVVKAYDGELYFVSNEAGPTLRRFDQPDVAVTSWDYGTALGVDSQLRVYGNTGSHEDSDIAAVKYHSGGCDNGICTDLINGDIDAPYLFATTPNGYLLGDGGEPGTAGSSPALWGPGGQFISFVLTFDGQASIRDRLDGNGVNLGAAWSSRAVLGDNDFYFHDETDDWYGASVIVSHSDFMVTQTYDDQSMTNSNFRGFFPGINPDFPNRAVPLLDIFPQLAAIDIESITSAASVDGYLYLTISGSDGLYLFGARDPSLVPEPTPLAFALLLVGLCVCCRTKTHH